MTDQPSPEWAAGVPVLEPVRPACSTGSPRTPGPAAGLAQLRPFGISTDNASHQSIAPISAPRSPRRGPCLCSTPVWADATINSLPSLFFLPVEK